MLVVVITMTICTIAKKQYSHSMTTAPSVDRETV